MNQQAVFQNLQRAAEINLAFLKNSAKIKEEYPDIEIFIEANLQEFYSTIEFYRTDEPISEFHFENIKNCLKSIHYFTQGLIEENEILEGVEIELIDEEKSLILALEDCKTFPIERF